MLRINIGTKNILLPLLLFLGFFALYLFNTLPGVGWADTARLALDSYTNNLRFDLVGGHPLHALCGRLLLHLPISSFAWRQNLLSAIFGAGGITLLFLFLRKARFDILPSVVASVVFGVSHTYWFVSTMNEHYSFGIFLIVLILLALMHWRTTLKKVSSGYSRFLLFIAAFLFGLALTNDMMPAFCAPAGIVFVLCYGGAKHVKSWKFWAGVIISFALGFFLWFYIYFGLPKVARPGFGSLLPEFTWAMNWKDSLRSLAQFVIFLFYQFPLIGFIFGLIGIRQMYLKHRDLFLITILIFVVDVTFASAYMRQRQVYIFLPAYLSFAIWIACGIEWLVLCFSTAPRNRRLAALAILLAIALPLASYPVAPLVCKKLHLPLGLVRTLHWRDNYSYYLWPGKRTEYGAYQYAWNVFRDAKPDAVILADYNPVMPLLYVQRVDGKRQDIQFALRIDEFYRSGDQVGNIMRFIDENYGRRPLYLADDYQPYYRTDIISKKYDIIPEGALFRIRKKRS